MMYHVYIWTYSKTYSHNYNLVFASIQETLLSPLKSMASIQFPLDSYLIINLSSTVAFSFVASLHPTCSSIITFWKTPTWTASTT
uniref:Uncharacterized protein n=1 Tax=Oryza brachyantha TaxID=4533 RepID=J3LQ86_ORYBR